MRDIDRYTAYAAERGLMVSYILETHIHADLAAGSTALAAELPGSRGIAAAELRGMLGEVTVLDVRGAAAFGGAHVPGAIHIGAGQNFALWAGWLLDAAKRIVLVGEEGDEPAARLAPVRVGLDGIEGFLAKGMRGWIDAGYDFTRTAQLS